ncbi:hypothetical protein [Serratia marcescens]|uniref:hypothetical protein n=1 Tax=Serratia marcescens TaxID=615 RepID=UPI00317E9B79
MTDDELTIVLFKGVIADLPAEQQETVHLCASKVRELLAEYPDGEAALAIGLIGAELQLKHG